jgi:hypothetical protein
VKPILSPSDLSFDNSDLVMLKSLLAGLSLPSRDSRADHGLDEESEGEWTQVWAGLQDILSGPAIPMGLL